MLKAQSQNKKFECQLANSQSKKEASGLICEIRGAYFANFATYSVGMRPLREENKTPFGCWRNKVLIF